MNGVCGAVVISPQDWGGNELATASGKSLPSSAFSFLQFKLYSTLIFQIHFSPRNDTQRISVNVAHSSSIVWTISEWVCVVLIQTNRSGRSQNTLLTDTCVTVNLQRKTWDIHKWFLYPKAFLFCLSQMCFRMIVLKMSQSFKVIVQLRKTNTMNESIGNIWIQVQFQVPVVRNWTMFWMFVQMNTCQHMIFYLLFVVDDSWIRGRDVRILLNRNVSGSLLPSLTFSLGVFALCLLAILCQLLCVLAVHFQLYTDIHTHLYYSQNTCL